MSIHQIPNAMVMQRPRTRTKLDGLIRFLKIPEGIDLALHRAKVWSKYAKDVMSYIEKRAHLGMNIYILFPSFSFQISLLFSPIINYSCFTISCHSNSSWTDSVFLFQSLTWMTNGSKLIMNLELYPWISIVATESHSLNPNIFFILHFDPFFQSTAVFWDQWHLCVGVVTNQWNTIFIHLEINTTRNTNTTANKQCVYVRFRVFGFRSRTCSKFGQIGANNETIAERRGEWSFSLSLSFHHPSSHFHSWVVNLFIWS